MGLKIIFLTIVISAVIVVSESEKRCNETAGHTRVKRAKYFSNPPQRFYKRPPMIYPVKGAFSYTPPPFMTDNEDSHPHGGRPHKVSRKPNNDRLGDEDINNIVKYLSKQDLDRLIEFAGEKDKYSKDVQFDYSNPPNRDDRTKYYRGPNAQQYKEAPFEYSNGPSDAQMYKGVPDIYGPKSPRPGVSPNYNYEQKPYEALYDNQQQQNVAPRIVNSNPNLNSIDSVNTPFDVQESMQNSQFAFFNTHIQEDINGRPTYNDNRETYTDTKVTREEVLPRPVNLREEEYYGSFTNNVPSVVKADLTSYKAENFGDLPLMNYHSKLDSVSSYHVPHYTVTTPNKKPSSYGASSSSASSSSSSNVPLEPAPPSSEAKSQSDAHLKATKIWTHKSPGTAYYLHSDGSLSLEKPQKPKPYGP